MDSRLISHSPAFTALKSLLLTSMLILTLTDFAIGYTNPANDSLSETIKALGLNPMEKVKVIITFGAHPGESESRLVKAAGGNIAFVFKRVHAIAAELPLAAIEQLAKLEIVASIEPDTEVKISDIELDNTWGVSRINAGEVHNAGNQGEGIKVAVFDSGIDYNHPDLTANYAGGYDFFNNDADPFDDNGHGTHVAGTIAAVDNGVGVVGVAPKAKIYALKVMGSNGTGYWSQTIAAMEWCMDNGIQVTNHSYSSTTEPSTAQAVFDQAYNEFGIIHVASAGNSGTTDTTLDNVGYPARCSSVIAVAALSTTNLRATYSSTGPDVEITAPGTAINSTMVGGTYGSKSGTSMASPHVAGVAALVLSSGIADQNGNGKVNDEVRARIDNSALDFGDAGRDNLYGYGLVDAYAAAQANMIKTVPPANTPTPTSTPVPPTNTPTSTPTVTNTPVPPTKTPTNTPISAPNIATVSSFTASIPVGKTVSKNLLVTAMVVDKQTGVGLSNAKMQMEILLNNVLLTRSTIGTDSTGLGELKVNNAKSGTYTIRILSVVYPNYEWDTNSLSIQFIK